MLGIVKITFKFTHLIKNWGAKINSKVVIITVVFPYLKTVLIYFTHNQFKPSHFFLDHVVVV